MILADLNEETVARHLGPRAADYPFPFQPEYARALSRHMGRNVRLAVSDCGAIALPLAHGAGWWCRLGQVLFPPMRGGERLDATEEVAFLRQLVAFLAVGRVCDRLVQPPPHCLFEAWPPEAQACAFGSYVLDLRQRTEEEMFSDMHTSHRYDIRAAQRQGLVIEQGPDQLASFYGLYQQTMRRSGMGVEPRGFFEDLLREGGARWLCASARGGDGPAAAAVFVACSRYSGFYLFGGSAERMAPAGAMKCLQWHVVRHLLAMGAGQYDLVGARLSDVSGTKLDGIQSFKARFGGTLRRGGLWKMDLRPVRVGLYDGARSIWRRLRRRGRPPMDIIDQELVKASANQDPEPGAMQ